MAKLTKRTVDSSAPRDRDYIVWDDTLAGFGLRVFASGKKSYLVQYRSQGRTRRLTLGPHGVLTPTEARKRATLQLASVTAGGDPAEARKTASRALTIDELAEIYLERHAAKKKTEAEDRRLLTKHVVPGLGANRKVPSIGRADVDRLHASMSKTPIQANRVLALVSKEGSRA